MCRNEHKDYNRSAVSKNIVETNLANRRPNPVINKYPERVSYFKKAEENRNPKKRICILSDSIPTGMRVKDFNNSLQNGFSKFKCFPGATIENLNYYSNPTLEEDKPEIVIIHVGINNILNNSNASDNEIAENIIKIGDKCSEHLVEKVMISGIVTCTGINPQKI